MTVLSSQRVLKEEETNERNSITSLSLNHKALSDISSLSEFKRLERLDLASNSLTSLEGLSGCVSLKWLSVVQNKLQSLRGVEALSNLTVFNAGKNKLKSFDEVRSLVSLRALILNDNEIVSVCKLDQMKEMNTLVLSRNPIREIGDSLVKVKAITKLSMSSCQLQTIGSSLKFCTELKELRLAHNEIKSLPAELAANKRLQNLDLGNNVITSWSDVKVLSSLVDLRNLNLLGNPVAENAKLAKKVQKLLPNLHIFNARPLNKSAKGGISDRLDTVDDFPPTSAHELHVQKDKKKEQSRDKKSSKHDWDQSKNDHVDDATDFNMEKDSKAETKTKGTVVKNEGVVETKRKRKTFQEQQESANAFEMEKKQKTKKKDGKMPKKDVTSHEVDTDASEKISKSKKPRKVQDILDVIDDPEASIADLISLNAAAESPEHDDKKKLAGKAVENGLVTISAKKKKKKNREVSVAVQLASGDEVGMGGPSTWGD